MKWGITASSGGGSTAIPTGAKAIWDFIDLTSDPGAFTLVNNGADSTTDEASNPNKAFEFISANSDYLKLAQQLSTSNTGTFHIRMKVTALGATQHAISNCLETRIDTIFSLLRINASGNYGIYFQKEGVSATNIETTSALSTGTWVDITIQSDGSNYFIYLDNVSQTFNVISGNDNGAWFNDITVDNFTVGALERTTVSSYADCVIDKIVYYERALNTFERQRLINYL